MCDASCNLHLTVRKPRPPCPSNCDQVQSYYELKCQGETRICHPLPTPPWHDARPHTAHGASILRAVIPPGILADTSFEPTHLVQLMPKEWQPERLKQIRGTLKQMCQLK